MNLKRLLTFPSPYTVLMIIIVLAALVTWVAPAGIFSRMSYDGDANNFSVTSPDTTVTLPATQQTLTDNGIRIPLEKFTEGNIKKPVAVPGTYVRTPQAAQGVGAVIKAPIEGIYEAIDVILFVLIIGGFIGVMKASGMFEAGVQWLARKLRGRESWLIIIVMVLIALGGTTFGMAEETLAFYPILVPVFLAARYDALVPVATIYIGSSIGAMYSTTNPFAVIIASDAAGVNWLSGLNMRLALLIIGAVIAIWYVVRYANRVQRDPTKSLLFGKKIEPPTAAGMAGEGPPPVMNLRRAVLLALFAASFLLMIYGVAILGWWFPEMTTLFLVAAIVAGVLAWQGERKFIRAFIGGAEEMLGVAFIIGIARGITIILNNGQVSDTMLHYASGLVEGMPAVAFILTLALIYAVLTIFIASSSGMAVLTMPIFGPLAGVIGVPPEMVVTAYLVGFGLMSFLTPAGLILPSLAMVDVPFDVWLRFSLPLLGVLAVVSAVALVIGVI